MPKVSVIVPVYGAENYIEQCVRSIMEQTFRDLEIVLVDDGSKDRSGIICDELAGEDPRIRVIHKENGGLTSAWIRGVQESSGEYLCFVDSDDWISHDLIERLARLAKGGQVREIISSDYLIERMNGAAPSISTSAAAPGEYTGERLQKDIKDRLLGNERRTVILSRCMKLIARSLIDGNTAFCDPRIRMGEDVVIMVPVVLDAQRVVIERYAGYHYRFVDDSMAHGYDPGLYDNILLLRQKLLEIIKAKGCPQLLPSVEREFYWLMLLELKIELRRQDIPSGEISQLVRKRIEDAGLLKLQNGFPAPPSDPAGRVLAFMIKRPDNIRVGLARKILRGGQKMRSAAGKRQSRTRTEKKLHE